MNELAEPTPIQGGYCVRRLDDHHCVDVLRMAYNWRLVLTERPVDEPEHGRCGIVGGWCYYGHGTDDTGRARTMSRAYLAALAAAEVFDGTGDPPGYNKRLIG